MAARDNHPGRAGGEHASSKNSKDAGDRARGGGGGGDGGVRINRTQKGMPAAPFDMKAPMEQNSLRTGPTIDLGSPTEKGLHALSFDDRFNTFKEHQDAVRDFVNRSKLGKFADFALGSFYNENVPDINNPRSFSGGTWHSSTNPYGVAAGMLSPYGSGFLTGPIVDQATVAAGIPGSQLWHGGSGPNSWGEASGGGLLGGGGNPSDPQGNRGAGGGLLQPTTQPGVTPLAPVAPAAQPAAQQAKERQKRMYALNGVNIPGPTPYSFTGAKWL